MHSSSIGGGGGGGGGFGFGGLLGFAVVSDTDRRGDARSRGFERVREESPRESKRRVRRSETEEG